MVANDIPRGSERATNISTTGLLGFPCAKVFVPAYVQLVSWTTWGGYCILSPKPTSVL